MKRRVAKGEGETCRRLADKLAIAFAVPASAIRIRPTIGPRGKSDLYAWEAFIDYERRNGDGFSVDSIPSHVARGPKINGQQKEGTLRLADLRHVTIAISSWDPITECLRNGFSLVCDNNTFTAYAAG